MLQELRDFVDFHSGGNALVVTYEVIEDCFSDLPGVRTGHFNKIAGLDTFGGVCSLFVIGCPLPSPEVHRRMALALTGRPIPGGDTTPGEPRATHGGLTLPPRCRCGPTLIPTWRRCASPLRMRQCCKRLAGAPPPSTRTRRGLLDSIIAG